jgi:hypothetical protein
MLQPLDFTAVECTVHSLMQQINNHGYDHDKISTIEACWSCKGLDLVFFTCYNRTINLSDLPSEESALHKHLTKSLDKFAALQLLLASLVVIDTSKWSVFRHFSITFTDTDGV